MNAGNRPAPRGRNIPIPREHGSWLLLFGPTGLAWIAAGTPSLEVLFLLVCLTALFLAREPLVCLVRQRRNPNPSPQRSFWWRWLLIYSAIGLIAGLPLLLLWSYLDLLLLVIPTAVILFFHLLIVTRREERSLPGEWLGVVGLSLAATATDVVSHGQLRPLGIYLWILAMSFFSSGLLHVRMSIARALGKKAEAAVTLSAGYHMTLAALLLLLIALGRISPWLGLAFVPALVRAFWPLLGPPPPRLNLKRTGYLEVLYGLLFVVSAGLALRYPWN